MLTYNSLGYRLQLFILVGLFFMRHSREVGNLFARGGGSLCSIAGPINKGALEALYTRAVRKLLHEIQQSCDLPFTQLENQQEGGATDASVQNCRFLYQQQFAFCNRSSLDSCSLIKIAQTHSVDVTIGDVHKIRNNL